MSQAIPENLRASLGIKFVIEQGWNWELDGTGSQIIIETCPYCKKNNKKFYMAVSDSRVSTRDGLYFCHNGSCAKTGNLRTLQEHLGVRIAGVDSRKEWAGSGEKKPDTLPDVELCHATLLGDPEAMDYLLNVRGFSKEIIDRQKLGLKEKVWFREAGESKALVIPYLVGGNVVYAKFRTLPPKPKDFVSPSGWEAPLYNGEILVEGLNEVIFTEGEADVLSMMSNGIKDVVGVPGANVKKAAWIETLDKIQPKKIYILYDNDKVGKKAAQEIASRIGIDKCLKLTLPPFEVEVDGVKRPGKDINEWFRYGGGTLELFEKIKESAALFDVTGVTSSGDALQQLMDELEGKVDLAPSYVFQWPELNRLIGLEDGDVLDIVAPEKVGKMQPLDSKVLMQNGTWSCIGALKLGDKLASVDGGENVVTGVFPQGISKIFKTTFADGRSTDVGAEHLWKVQCVNPWENGWRVFTTDAIQQHHCNGRHPAKVFVPLISGDYGIQSNLPFDPWMLGVLIGDGSINKSGHTSLTTIDEEVVREFESRLKKYDININAIGEQRGRWKNGHIKAGSKTVKQFGISGSNMLTIVRNLGLNGHRAETKFIPKVYLEADKESRWELLRGLMDTDGTAGNKHGVLSYCTISSQLAEDFVYLVRSLGGLAKVGKPQKKHFKYKGEMRTGQPAYVIVARLPEREKAFTLKRKLDKVSPRLHLPKLTFSSVTYIGDKEAVCISVSHPSKLYITDDFIVTHNTTMGMNIMDHMVGMYGEDGLIVCLEMTQARLSRKHVALITGFEDTLTEPGTEESRKKLEELKAACVTAKSVMQTRDADLYFAYPLQWQEDPESVFKLIKDCIRRYGVKWVMFDNLQKFCDESLKQQNHRTIYLSQLSKKFASIAKDYKIKLIRILQPKRIERGATISTNDVDGSSQVAKDCDGMITLWRSVVGELKKSEWETQQAGFEESAESFEPVMKVTVGLSRYSAGGTTKLFYDGARSQVRSLNTTQKDAMKPMANLPNGSIPMEGGGSLSIIPTENLAPATVPTESEIKI